jgi:hypothetical protein
VPDAEAFDACPDTKILDVGPIWSVWVKLVGQEMGREIRVGWGIENGEQVRGERGTEAVGESGKVVLRNTRQERRPKAIGDIAGHGDGIANLAKTDIRPTPRHEIRAAMRGGEGEEGHGVVICGMDVRQEMACIKSSLRVPWIRLFQKGNATGEDCSVSAYHRMGHEIELPSLALLGENSIEGLCSLLDSPRAIGKRKKRNIRAEVERWGSLEGISHSPWNTRDYNLGPNLAPQNLQDSAPVMQPETWKCRRSSHIEPIQTCPSRIKRLTQVDTQRDGCPATDHDKARLDSSGSVRAQTALDCRRATCHPRPGLPFFVGCEAFSSPYPRLTFDQKRMSRGDTIRQDEVRRASPMSSSPFALSEVLVA